MYLLNILNLVHIIFIGLLSAIVYPSLIHANSNNATPLSERLQNEFQNAYPEHAPTANKVKSFNLEAIESEWGFIPPYQTAVWSYNGKIPGPVFRIKLGETLKVNFRNRLSQPTSIHWHGVRVPNAMDGVPGVTQAAIASGESFIYQFTPKDAGTFWFHPHIKAAEQIERGLHGVLIVEDQNDPVYSQDLVLVLDDWLLQKNNQINDHFVSRHDLAHDGRWGNIATVNGQYQPTISVQAGQRIRLRLINVANGRVFAPILNGLSAQIIAVDGMLVEKPIPLSHFKLAPGNRIDLDLIIPRHANGQSFELVNTFSRNIMPLATLTVDDTPAVITPRFITPHAKYFPNWNDALLSPLTHHYQLDAQAGGPFGIAWTIDGDIWPDSKPVKLTKGRFSRLRFTNRSSRLHPMHLHGQFFKVISRNGQQAHENFWRDTVLIGARESIDIALMPLDPGTWMNHCHILEHAEAGMMTSITVQEP